MKELIKKVEKEGKKVTKNFFLAITNDTHVYNYFSCNGGEIRLIKFYCHDVDMAVENKKRKREERKKEKVSNQN